MRRRPYAVSTLERAASFAAASGVTVGAALLVLAALVPRFGAPSTIAPATEVRNAAERVVFVASPTPAPVVVPATRPLPPPTATSSVPAVTSPQHESIAGSVRDTTSGAVAAPRRDSRASSTGTLPTTNAQTATAGAPAAIASVGFRLPSRPLRLDSALRSMTDSVGNGLATGALKPPPLTQAEIDAKWRAEAFEVAAARGAGEPVRRPMAGGSIPVPLPFGGPSRKARERDRAIEAQLKVSRAIRQARLDSVVTARKRRTDSLARIADSTRR